MIMQAIPVDSKGRKPVGVSSGNTTRSMRSIELALRPIRYLSGKLYLHIAVPEAGLTMELPTCKTTVLSRCSEPVYWFIGPAMCHSHSEDPFL